MAAEFARYRDIVMNDARFFLSDIAHARINAVGMPIVISGSRFGIRTKDQVDRAIMVFVVNRKSVASVAPKCHTIFHKCHSVTHFCLIAPVFVL